MAAAVVAQGRRQAHGGDANEVPNSTTLKAFALRASNVLALTTTPRVGALLSA
ncbi:hypothetical protein H6CHR_04032 [Variovorax sp. PBL-H6]|nr:hypothetical protein H6CHR_04032 [Variovorax sp. PBL-H6]